MVAPLSQNPLDRARLSIDAARAAERRDAPDDALARYDEALKLLEGLEPAELLADALRWKGTVHRERGETEEARVLYARSAAIADTLGYRAGKAHALNCLAAVAQRRGDMAEAERLYRLAALVGAEAGDQRLLDMIQQNLGILANIRGDLDEALRRYRMSLRAYEAAGDDQTAALTWNNLGMLHTDCGEFIEAELAYERAIAIANRRGDVHVARAVGLNRIELLIAVARWAEADEHCSRALDAAERRRDRARRAEALKFLGVIERNRRQYDRAADALAEARGLATECGDVLLSAELLSELGETWCLRGDAREACAAWEEAATVFERVGAKPNARALRGRVAELRA